MRGGRLRRSLILAALALASAAAEANAQTPLPAAKPSPADLEIIRGRLVQLLKTELSQINLIPDDEPMPEPLVMNRLRIMVSPRLSYDRLDQADGQVERKIGEILFQTFEIFTGGGVKSVVEYAPVYRIADSGTLTFRPCQLDLAYEVDEPAGITLKDSEGGTRERAGHQKFALNLAMNFATINKIYSDGRAIWFYGSGKVASVQLAITATYLDKPAPARDRSDVGNDSGVTFTLVDAAQLNRTVADFRQIMQSCQPAP